jgi:hypothetical protein
MISRSSRGISRPSRLRYIFIVIVIFILCFLQYQYATKFRTLRFFYKDYLYYYVVGRYFYDDQSDGSIYHKIAIPNDPQGCVIDIGANDGIFVSNSYFPLQFKQFQGFLYEMDIEQCGKLWNLYSSNDKVQIFCIGLSDFLGFHEYKRFPLGLENTFSKEKADQYDSDIVPRLVQAPIMNSNMICEFIKSKYTCNYMILSIDVEGQYENILKGLQSCPVDLLILEGVLENLNHFTNRACQHEFKAVYNNVYSCKASLS